MIIHGAPANPKYTRGGGPPVLRCLDQKIPLVKQKRIDVAAPYGKITAADLKKLGKKKKNGSKKKSKKS